MKSGSDRSVSSYYSRRPSAEENSISEYSPPAFWKRFLLFALVFIAVQLAAAPLGVLRPSERLLAGAPLMWLADFLYARRYLLWQRLTIGQRIYLVGADVGLGVLMLVTFWSLLDWQARELGGRIATSEPFARLYIMIGLWILFVWLFQLCKGVLRPGFERIKIALRWANGVALLLAFLLYLPYLFLALQIHRGKIANATNPRAKLGLPYEAVTFHAADGMPLSGWYIPYQNSAKAVVLCHGVSANKAAFLGIASFLHHAGYNVFMFDFRGHGDSGGYTTSLGYFEARDVEAAVRYVQSRPEVKRIDGYGFSMGGVATLLAAAKTPTIERVVADSAFADLPTLARQEFVSLPLGLDSVALPVLDIYVRLSLGVSLRAIAPRDGMASLSPRPLFIIHGLADTRVPPQQAETNFREARQPKQLWLVPGATHVQAHRQEGEDYEQRVLRFLR